MKPASGAGGFNGRIFPQNVSAPLPRARVYLKIECQVMREAVRRRALLGGPSANIHAV